MSMSGGGSRTGMLVYDYVACKAADHCPPYRPPQFLKASAYPVDSDEESLVGKMPPSDSDED